MGKARNTCKNLALQSDLSRQYHLSLLERLWLVLHVQHVFRALPHLSQRRTGPVFQSRQGGLYSKRRIQQIVREVAKRAGITRRVYPHLLRHTVAQHLADRGMPEELLQKFLGLREARDDPDLLPACSLAGEAFVQRSDGEESPVKGVRVPWVAPTV